MLDVENWAEIRRLHRAEAMPIKVIARIMGVSKNTVRSALARDVAPRYERAPRGSIVDEVEPRIRELLQAWPTMPATVIAERIDWGQSITVLRERVRALRPVYLPPDPASRTSYDPGEIAQDDLWFPDVDLPLGFGQNGRATTPVLVQSTGYARFLDAVLIPSRQAEDLYAGWWQLIERLGAVPRAFVWDGEGAVGRWRRGRSELTGACQGFRGVLGAKVIICRPADPETKGITERNNGYLETSFLPGRSFSSPADFNAQLAEWLGLANGRVKRTLGCAPSERIEADRAAMLALPPVAPVTGWANSLLLPRDHYVRVAANDYSVDPAVIGRRVQVHADPWGVWVTCEGRRVADHARCWARHQTITDPAHRAAAERLRRSHVGRALRPADAEVATRVLGDYDRAFGLDGGEVA